MLKLWIAIGDADNAWAKGHQCYGIRNQGKGMVEWGTPLGRVFKIDKIFPRHFMSNKWHFTRQPHPVRGDIW